MFAPPAHAAPEENDNFANAIVVTGESGTIAGNNTDATLEGGESKCPMPSETTQVNTLWYSWTTPETGRYTFDTLVDAGENAGDTVLGVYTGSSVSALTRIVCNDNYREDGYRGLGSKVEFEAVKDEVFRIQVGAYRIPHFNATLSGAFNLSWAVVPPDADGDSVPDATDACPDTAPGASVNSSGCSEAQRDSDGDTYKDDVDACEDTASGAEVDGSGCSAAQRDTDDDEVNDDADQCPDAAEDRDQLFDADGCPDEAFATKVTIELLPKRQRVRGAVSVDPHPACEVGRGVVLKKERKGHDRFLGRTSTGALGKYSFDISAHSRGSFYVVVKRKVLRSEEDPTVVLCRRTSSRQVGFDQG